MLFRSWGVQDVMGVKLVRQNSKKPGCGPACVAMLAGLSKPANHHFASGDSQRTFWPDIIIALLAEKLIPSKPRWGGLLSAKHLPKENLERELKNRSVGSAILKVNKNNQNKWHWIVWDAECSKILDPLDGSVKRERRRYKITAFMEVQKK